VEPRYPRTQAGICGPGEALVHRAVQRDIDLAWVYDDGRYAGRLAALHGGDARVRMSQYRAAADDGRALAAAAA
jgi:CRISPR/Cas system-associated endonuclease Cas1